MSNFRVMTSLVAEAANSLTASSNAPPGAPSTSSHKRILVVEDEFLIRMIVSDGLRDAGCHVVEAFNADEALKVLQTSVSFDLIVSDVRMPGSLDGIGLLMFVIENFPALPIKITSGHLDPAQAISKGANEYVPKPFPVKWLVKAVQDELAKAL